MTKKTNIKRILGVLLAGIMTVVSFAPPAWADEDRNDKLHPGISPVRASIELDPGQSYSDSFRVSNVGIETFEFKVYVTPFQVSDDSGTPNFNDSSKYTQIEDWIETDIKTGKIAPGESQIINYTVNVPVGAAGGGQYAAIMIEADNEIDDKNSVQIGEITRIGYIIYAQVNGEINECVKVVNNNINGFMFEPPISATSLIENCGNIHLNAEYIMKVTPLFSDTVIYTNEEDPETHTVMPEARRYNTTSWTKEQGAPMMGIYNVEQTVKIGKETSTIKKLVFIFPLWLIIIFILLIAAIVFWLVSRSRQRKESKRESVNNSTKD